MFMKIEDAPVLNAKRLQAVTNKKLLLPDKTNHHYTIPRARHHDRQLVDKRNKLFSNNFMVQMLYTEYIQTPIDCVCISCVLATFNKDDDDDDDDDDNEVIMLRLCKSLVRPHLEFCRPISNWSPFTQHRFTSMIPGNAAIRRHNKLESLHGLVREA